MVNNPSLRGISEDIYALIVKLQLLAINLAMCMTLFKDTWFAHLQQQCILLLLHDIYDYIRTIYEFGELNLIHQYFTQPNPVNNLWFSFKKNYAATYCHGTTDSKVFHVIIKKASGHIL